jgi:ubiquinone/menaquinone biosynthesis C-methylase UbiE
MTDVEPDFTRWDWQRMAGGDGKVVSADIQEGMLQKLRNKVSGTEFEDRIELVKCEGDGINVRRRVDLTLAFFMVHEVPDKDSLFHQMKAILDEKGQFLLNEPKLFRVSREEFAQSSTLAENAGFEVSQDPRVRFSWSAILRQAQLTS